MTEYKKSKWGERRKIKRCRCGGTVWEYEAIGFLPKVRKCDFCGAGY